jgi:hypothetical protein
VGCPRAGYLVRTSQTGLNRKTSTSAVASTHRAAVRMFRFRRATKGKDYGEARTRYSSTSDLLRSPQGWDDGWQLGHLRSRRHRQSHLEPTQQSLSTKRLIDGKSLALTALATLAGGVILATLDGCSGRERAPAQQHDETPCIGAGQTYDARFGIKCCAGLQSLELIIPVDSQDGSARPSGDCDVGPYPESAKLCSSCGDGVCSELENRCNCTEDCPDR